MLIYCVKLRSLRRVSGNIAFLSKATVFVGNTIFSDTVDTLTATGIASLASFSLIYLATPSTQDAFQLSRESHDTSTSPGVSGFNSSSETILTFSDEAHAFRRGDFIKFPKVSLSNPSGTTIVTSWFGKVCKPRTIRIARGKSRGIFHISAQFGKVPCFISSFSCFALNQEITTGTFE